MFSSTAYLKNVVKSTGKNLRLNYIFCKNNEKQKENSCFSKNFETFFKTTFTQNTLSQLLNGLLMVVQGHIITLNYIHAFGSNQFSFILLCKNFNLILAKNFKVGRCS